MNKTNRKVDIILSKATKWQEEMAALRGIALDCGLTEELKWRWPCYVLDEANVVLIHSFKEYCALLFFKGALMKDPKGILIRQTENVQAARQVRFTGLQQIVKMKSTVKAYILEAIAVEKSGAQVEYKKTADFKVPAEFKKKLDENGALKTAFRALTPGRQRAYLYYFSSAKQSSTREARVKKFIPQIMKGKGMDDE